MVVAVRSSLVPSVDAKTKSSSDGTTAASVASERNASASAAAATIAVRTMQSSSDTVCDRDRRVTGAEDVPPVAEPVRQRRPSCPSRVCRRWSCPGPPPSARYTMTSASVTNVSTNPGQRRARAKLPMTWGRSAAPMIGSANDPSANTRPRPSAAAIVSAASATDRIERGSVDGHRWARPVARGPMDHRRVPGRCERAHRPVNGDDRGRRSTGRGPRPVRQDQDERCTRCAEGAPGCPAAVRRARPSRR